MMKTLLCVLLFTLTLSCDFELYCEDYHKNYASPQRQMRAEIFLTKCLNIDSVNAQNLGYELGVNNFTDWTEEELARFNNASIDNNIKISAVEGKDPEKVGYPTTKDWRSEGKVTPPKNQGTCGSCWAFSSAAVFQSLLLISTNKNMDSSEEYVLECSNRNRSDCEGGYVTDAYNLMINTGLPTQTDFPYQAVNTGGITPFTSGICTAGNLTKLPGSTTYKVYNMISNDDLKELLMAGPVVSLIMADSNFVSYKSGTFACSKVAGKNDLNHAVTIVGYDTEKYFVKNSYGAGWGNQGYMDLSPNMDCGIKLYVYQLYNNPTAKNGIMVVLSAILLALSVATF